MSGLTSRNSKGTISQIRPIVSNSIHQTDEKSKESSVIRTISNDSNDAVGHASTHTDTKQFRRYSMVNLFYEFTKYLN